MNDTTKPTNEQRLMAELAGQRNQALDALAQTAAELGATRDALQAAEARIKELEAEAARPIARNAFRDAPDVRAVAGLEAA